MLERTRRKWVDIQIDIFLDEARRHSVPGDGDRFEVDLDRLFPRIHTGDAPTRQDYRGRSTHRRVRDER